MIKLLNADSVEFVANETKYILEPNLSIVRYKAFQKFSIQLGFGVTYMRLFNAHKQNIEFWNDFVAGDRTIPTKAIIFNNDILVGLSQLDDREDASLYVATLFWNTVDEDTGDWTMEMATKKIDDWKKENIAMGFFLTFSLSTIHGFKDSLEDLEQGMENKQKENGME